MSAGRVLCCLDFGFRSIVVCFCCLSVCLLVAAAVTLESVIVDSVRVMLLGVSVLRWGTLLRLCSGSPWYGPVPALEASYALVEGGHTPSPCSLSEILLLNVLSG